MNTYTTVVHAAAPNAPGHYSAAGIGDYVSPPDLGSWSAIAPAIAYLVALLSGAAIIIGILMLFINLVAFAGSGRNIESKDKALEGMKVSGVSIVIGAVLVTVFLKVYPLLTTFASK